AKGLSYIDAIGYCLQRQSADYIWQINVSRLNDPTRENKSSHVPYWAWKICSINRINSDGGTMEERGQRLNAAILEAIEIVKNKH
ncbi:hypothetical protein ACU385_005498, partial [Escherichia coli]